MLPIGRMRRKLLVLLLYMGKAATWAREMSMLRSAFSVCLFQMQWPTQRALSGLLVTTMSLWLICFWAVISKPAGQMAHPPIGFICIC